MTQLTSLTLPSLVDLRSRIDAFWNHSEAPVLHVEDQVFFSGFLVPPLLEGSGWRMTGGDVSNEKGELFSHYWAFSPTGIVDIFADIHSSERVRITGINDLRYCPDIALEGGIKDPSWLVLETLGSMIPLWEQLVEHFHDTP